MTTKDVVNGRVIGGTAHEQAVINSITAPAKDPRLVQDLRAEANMDARARGDKEPFKRAR